MGIQEGPKKLGSQIRAGTLAVPGVFNAFTARLVENAGFPAVYVSGAGLSASRAMPDIGLLTMTEVATATRHIVQMINIPVIVDADTGFGEVHHVNRAVGELESAGAAGIQLEDQIMAKRCGHLPGKELIDSKAMSLKIAAAVEAKHNPNLLIIARTDARAKEGLDGAIHRALTYRDAGADAIFPEALESAEEFESFANAMNDPAVILVANMTEWGNTPLLSVTEFSQMGYQIVLFPMTLFRMMAKGMEEALDELKKSGTQKALLERMQSRSELYEVLHYDGNGQIAGVGKAGMSWKR
ncbi:MAG: methylisocitrate lyase [Nitrospirales bacterium]|nr:MAG: methylisocitrate lyase [Nitrospirales bacterium]